MISRAVEEYEPFALEGFHGGECGGDLSSWKNIGVTLHHVRLKSTEVQWHCWEEVAHINFNDVMLWGMKLRESLVSTSMVSCLWGILGLEKEWRLCEYGSDICTRMRSVCWLVSPNA